MKSRRKTYAVKNLMEWHPMIQCGKAYITISFTGGSLTGYGVVPAEYTTENPVVQRIIESSDYYKNKKIFLLRETEGSGKYEDKQSEMTQAQAQEFIAKTDDAEPTTPRAIVEVTDVDDARDYLFDEFGINRSALRSVLSVKRAGEEHNIEFKGI